MARALRAVPAGPIQAIGYIRVSKAREEMISPDLQRAAITRWAGENNRAVTVWLEDLNRSGRGFAKRKIEAAVEQIKAGEAAEILVYRYDRWGRNTVESLANIARTEQAGGHVVSVTEPFDVETAVGKYTRSNALALAQMQSDILGEGWKATQAHRISEGLPASGQPRFGYTYVPKKKGGDGRYHPDPTTGPLMAGFYPRWLAGETFGAFARELNAAGHRTPRFGSPWRDDYLRDAMDSGFAAGYLPQSELRGVHLPLITEDVWSAYRRKRTLTPKAPARRKAATYRLTNLLTCGHCGGATNHTGRQRLICRRYAQSRFCVNLGATRPAVEGVVRVWLEELLVEEAEDVRRGAAAQARASRAKADEVLLKAEKVEVERLMLKAFDAHLRDIVDESTYRAHRGELQHRLDELDSTLNNLEHTPDIDRKVIANALNVWDRLPPAQMNVLLKALVGAVIVRRDRVFVIPRWDLLT